MKMPLCIIIQWSWPYMSQCYKEAGMLLTDTKQNMHTIKKLNETIPACVCMSIHNACIATQVRTFNLPYALLSLTTTA